MVIVTEGRFLLIEFIFKGEKIIYHEFSCKIINDTIYINTIDGLPIKMG